MITPTRSQYKLHTAGMSRKQIWDMVDLAHDLTQSKIADVFVFVESYLRWFLLEDAAGINSVWVSDEDGEDIEILDLHDLSHIEVHFRHRPSTIEVK